MITLDKSRIPQLDGLRFVAVFIVYLSHFSNSTGVLGGRLGYGAGQIGVMVFFILSGYLMGHLYFDRPLTPRAVATFFVRRAARIAPLYFAIVFMSWLTISQLSLKVPLYSITSTNITQHLFFIKGVEILWTVPIEVQFYALFPIAWGIRLLSPWGSLIFFAVIVIAIIYLRLPDQLEMHNLFRYVHFFVAGLLCSIVAPVLGRCNVPARLWDGLFVFLMLGTILLFPKVRELVAGAGTRPWSDPLVVLMLSGLLLSTLSSSWALALLGHPILRYPGVVSYGIYLLHMPVLSAIIQLNAFGDQLFAQFLAGMLLTFVAASLSFELSERRIIRLAALKTRSRNI